MGAIPGSIETDAGPPMAIPLRHFVVGLGFLVAAGVVGALAPLGVVPGRPTLAHLHLLLAGWACVTIMGAMTQFVPVWSGATLHSRRLAAVQLPLVTAGIAGLVGSFLWGAYELLPAAGALALAGFWTFAYNVARTLVPVRPWDVTERHFAIALGFLGLATLLGLALALSYARPGLASFRALVPPPVARPALRAAHATLAVFGAVLTTVVGALYQLGPMFTGSDPHGVDAPLRRIEELGYPVGVLALAAGRLSGNVLLGRVGALLVVAGLVAFGVVLARRLHESTVAWTPMLARYAVVAVAIPVWAAVAVPAWYADPVSPIAVFGPPELDVLLLLGVVGFVILGTLYHVVPFIVWVHRYGDRLGFGDVPVIDDLYDDRLATADFALVLAGLGTLLLAALRGLPASAVAAGWALAACGFLVFATNMLLVVRDHGGRSLVGTVLPGTGG